MSYDCGSVFIDIETQTFERHLVQCLALLLWASPIELVSLGEQLKGKTNSAANLLVLFAGRSDESLRLNKIGLDGCLPRLEVVERNSVSFVGVKQFLLTPL